MAQNRAPAGSHRRRPLLASARAARRDALKRHDGLGAKPRDIPLRRRSTAFALFLDPRTELVTVAFGSNPWQQPKFVVLSVLQTSKCPTGWLNAVTDNAGAYRSRSWRRVCARNRVRRRFTRPYRPQTNGKAEALIKTLLRMGLPLPLSHKPAPQPSPARLPQVVQPPSTTRLTRLPTADQSRLKCLWSLHLGPLVAAALLPSPPVRLRRAPALTQVP